MKAIPKEMRIERREIRRGGRIMYLKLVAKLKKRTLTVKILKLMIILLAQRNNELICFA